MSVWIRHPMGWTVSVARKYPVRAVHASTSKVRGGESKAVVLKLHFGSVERCSQPLYSSRARVLVSNYGCNSLPLFSVEICLPHSHRVSFSFPHTISSLPFLYPVASPFRCLSINILCFFPPKPCPVTTITPVHLAPEIVIMNHPFSITKTSVQTTTSSAGEL